MTLTCNTFHTRLFCDSSEWETAETAETMRRQCPVDKGYFLVVVVLL